MAIPNLKNSILGSIGGLSNPASPAYPSPLTVGQIPDVWLNQVTGAITTTMHESASRHETISNASWRMSAINMRLRDNYDGTPKGLQDMHTTLSGDKVFIFIVVRGEAVVLEDEASMFPSDVLVTKIRLLQE